MSEPAKSAAVAHTPTDIELAALRMTERLRDQADDVASRLKMSCTPYTRLHRAQDMRAVARSLQYAAEHIAANADTLEASHAS